MLKAQLDRKTVGKYVRNLPAKERAAMAATYSKIFEILAKLAGAAVKRGKSGDGRFVLWWDGQEKQNGARGIGKKVASQIGNATLEDLHLDRDTVHRWRTRLKDENK